MVWFTSLCLGKYIISAFILNCRNVLQGIGCLFSETALCCRSCDSELQQLPVRWMNELLDMLQSATASQSLSFTRRSAGLPFFIQVSW